MIALGDVETHYKNHNKKKVHSHMDALSRISVDLNGYYRSSCARIDVMSFAVSANLFGYPVSEIKPARHLFDILFAQRAPSDQRRYTTTNLG
ncbi:hypothetical protein PCANC_08979 [Puccinia coronata f. sp. avenae]|uniref:Uncharacterized protein n=1 Tax=Puccinia coronata f. sp. avenae TaxID=200324 RepID=A0A2N5VHR6_9BASI|nr:hypothetical protein PCANC_08979 [Puccinia coronata f. sp. avenae]